MVDFFRRQVLRNHACKTERGPHFGNWNLPDGIWSSRIALSLKESAGGFHLPRSSASPCPIPKSVIITPAVELAGATPGSSAPSCQEQHKPSPQTAYVPVFALLCRSCPPRDAWFSTVLPCPRKHRRCIPLR